MNQLRPAVVSLALLTVLTGGLYPLAVTAIAQVLFPWQANGSLIVQDGKTVGSVLIGQPFDDPKYFWTRLSATAAPGYNGAGSSGSNLGPLNDALTAAVQGRIDALKAVDPGNVLPIPVDLVTASGSGLDPHISPTNAALQAARVARARSIPPEKVRELIAGNIDSADFGLLGEDGVNVLKLNLALDSLTKQTP